MNTLFYLVPVFGVVALFYTFIKSSWVSKQPAGNEKMQTISGHIADGAMAFLKAEYRILTYFVIIVAILLGIMGYSNANSHWSIGVAFVLEQFLVRQQVL
jgi:K(+)-stimulated pyrophosphate-energized sodium pump